MRKIEEQMLNAIRSRKNWAGGNTQVVVHNPTGTSDIHLHGNHIASVPSDLSGIIVNTDTLRRWPTVTTKSRLRALGANITQQKGVIYLDGKAVAEV